MKIVLIGPTYPFRGGIAHHTTLLCKALRKKHEVIFISFKRQYPKVLFPGKSDRDPSKNPVRIDDVHYLLDPLNPFSWVKVFKTIKKINPDKVIIPWWVSFWTPPYWSILTMVKRTFPCEIVFICHNVVEHESNVLKKIATKAVLSRGNRLITHSSEETDRLKNLMGEHISVITAFHPTYADLSDMRHSKEEAKERLHLSGSVLLFFGFVRKYKGLAVLLDAMPEILKEKAVTLLVVGEFWEDKKNYLDKIDRLEITQRVKIIDRYIPNEEIGLYFAAADLVVQPYLSATGSGICQIAYGFDRPVIATNAGCLPEVIENGVNGRIVESRDAQGLAKAILESLEPDTLAQFSQNAVNTKEKFSWERLADIICLNKPTSIKKQN